MSANQSPSNATQLWKQFPNNIRIGFLLLCMILVWRLPLGASLWLDEGLTAWVTRDTLGAAADRAVAFQGQSPLYFILSWIVQLIAGSSEFSLRSTSLLATCASVAMLFALARRLGGSELGWLAGAIFITLDPVQVAAVSARPYALALFFAMASVWALLRWEEDGRYRYSLLYLACFLTSVYLQYLFVCMLAVHIVHFALFYRTQRIKLPSFLSELLLVAALLVPAYLHMEELSQRRALLQFVPPPTTDALLSAIFPPALLTAAVVAVLFAVLTGGSRAIRASHADIRIGIWIGWWYLFPPLLIFAVSIWGGVSIFLERYFLYYTPAVAILCAALMLRWRDERTRAICVAGFMVLLCVREIDRRWIVEDWRGAAEQLAQRGGGLPALVYPGLAEARDLQWLHDEGKQEYLLSPLLYYQAVNPMAVLPPPSALQTEAGERYFVDLLASRFTSNSRGFFVGLNQQSTSGPTVSQWLERFKREGFETAEIPLAPGSRVQLFELSKKQQPALNPAPDGQSASIAPADSAVLTAPPA